MTVSSYLKALYETYTKAEELGLVDTYDEKGVGVRPIYHTSKRATKSSKVYDVTLDKDGKFVTATELMDDEYVTYPTTLESITRTAGIAPHGLSDSLKYLVSSYNESSNLAYMENLHGWARSIYKTDLVGVAYTYLFEDRLEEDLKGLGYTPKDTTFVTFTLLTEDGDLVTLNDDKETHDGWIGYMLSKREESDEGKDISDLTGDEVFVPVSYKGTLGTSKIISVALKPETYVGRFPKSGKGELNPTFKLGLEESLKIFNMIDYLIMCKETRTYLRMGNPILMWTDELHGVKSPTTKIEEGEDDYLLSLFEQQGIDTSVSSLDTVNLLSEIRRSQMGKTYENLSDIYMLELDKISNGRVSVKNFMTFTESDYDARLGYWYKTTSWEWGYGKNKGSLALKDLALRLVGKEEEDKGKSVLKVTGESAELYVDKLVSDLVRSKVFLQRFPIHLYKKAMENARNRQRYEKTWQRELQAVMSVYKKYQWDYKKEEVCEVSNENTEQTDSYKVGQLLAVYERIEEYANYIKGNNRVETQVSKMWNTATQRPLYALSKIKQQTIPSVNVLKNKNKLFDLEDRITTYMSDLADSETFKPNKPLKDEFILGYYHEKRDLYSKVRPTDVAETTEVTVIEE